MRNLIIVLFMLAFPIGSAHAEVSVAVGINIPGLSIGINMPTYPRLVSVPGYPVYYDPRVDSNYFFYDGLYWVLYGDDWYMSSWYNGPWDRVERYDVPLYVLRVPVRYYRRPPPYFRGWHVDAPPRWADRWGNDWEQRNKGWDKWNRRQTPRPAPLPSYQRRFTGDSYPREPEVQHIIRSKKYNYQPRETVTRERYQEQNRSQEQRRQPPKQGKAPPEKGQSRNNGKQNNREWNDKR